MNESLFTKLFKVTNSYINHENIILVNRKTLETNKYLVESFINQHFKETLVQQYAISCLINFFYKIDYLTDNEMFDYMMSDFIDDLELEYGIIYYDTIKKTEQDLIKEFENSKSIEERLLKTFEYNLLKLHNKELIFIPQYLYYIKTIN